METILTVKEESMVAVADAVREKAGTTESLSFPDGMVSAINSIETTAVDLTGYATEEYVDEAISNIEFPETDLIGYATETYVNDAISNIEFPETDLTGYATQTYVDEAIAAIPETDLTGYATTEYVDQKVAEIEPGSGGSSVSADNETIIDDGGVLRTAIGGSKTLVATGEEFYNYSDEVGITNRNSGNSRMDLPNYPASTIFTLNPSLNYDFEIHLRNAETGYTDIMTGYTEFVDNYEVSLIGNTTITDTTISIGLYNPSDGYIQWNNGFDMFEKYYITYISFKKQDQYEYNKIDSNYIKLGNGLNVNATGEIIVESNLANLSGDSTRNIILQSTNTQSTGSIENSAAFGYKNQLGGQGSISLGRENKQNSGAVEITIGDANEVSSYQNFVFGMKNKALDYSGNVIVGSNNYSKQSNSFIGGSYLQASKANQTLYGTYNKLDAEAAVVIGCGDSSTRKNGLVIGSDQVAHFPGSVVIGENKDEVATKAYINEVLGVIEDGYY